MSQYFTLSLPFTVSVIFRPDSPGGQFTSPLHMNAYPEAGQSSGDRCWRPPTYPANWQSMGLSVQPCGPALGFAQQAPTSNFGFVVLNGTAAYPRSGIPAGQGLFPNAAYEQLSPGTWRRLTAVVTAGPSAAAPVSVALYRTSTTPVTGARGYQRMMRLSSRLALFPLLSAHIAHSLTLHLSNDIYLHP